MKIDEGNVMYFARPGNGKTLQMARVADALFKEYRWVQRKYPQLPKRALWSNMKFSKAIEDAHLGYDLHYWTDPRELYGLRDVDILWDDIGIYLATEEWDKVDKRLRKMLIMYRHRGLRIYATTQDYKQVAIQYRRMVKTAYKMTKVIGSRDKSATRPPVKRVWGLIWLRKFDVEELEAQKSGGASLKRLKKDGSAFFPSDWFFIERDLVDMYDSYEELDPVDRFELELIEWRHPGTGHTIKEWVKIR